MGDGDEEGFFWWVGGREVERVGGGEGEGCVGGWGGGVSLGFGCFWGWCWYCDGWVLGFEGCLFD